MDFYTEWSKLMVILKNKRGVNEICERNEKH
jgi:hypothetical protein